jgi:hypothetical protein
MKSRRRSLSGFLFMAFFRLFSDYLNAYPQRLAIVCIKLAAYRIDTAIR